MKVVRSNRSRSVQPGAEASGEAPATSAPYSALAAGYDVVMEHVEYDVWAEYIYGLMKRHHPDPRAVLELGCGTGSLALELYGLGRFRYAGTDRSPEMIRVARAKAELEGAPIQFEVADFTDFRVSEPVDVVVLLYDGLNYLLETAQVEALFRCAYAALRPNGIFIFDQSTPANSINNEAFFRDEGEADGFRYVRNSQYDPETRLHTTTFDLSVEGEHFYETHVQRAYSLEEMRALLPASGLVESAAYDGFSTAPATEESERVHWVVCRPA